jgi:hypothetical protein
MRANATRRSRTSLPTRAIARADIAPARRRLPPARPEPTSRRTHKGLLHRS